MNEFDKLIAVDEVLDQERRHKQALMLLLDAQSERKDHLTALGAKMGATRSYITAAPLSWIAQKVRLAVELPLFKQYRDEDTGKVRLNRETAALMQQREPDWRRQFPMTLYLAKRKRHKFPPLLLVITQPWVDNESANEWGPQGKAIRDSVSAQSLDSQGRVIDLAISGEDLLYAIDGQHRLMAIKGLAALLDTGHISPRDQDMQEIKGKKVTLDEIVASSNGETTHSQLQQLLGESVGIEIIPAVMKGETRKEALQRIRSIFVHVNRSAMPLSQGELALLDEDDGYAVVSRILMVTHPLLKDRVLLKGAQLTGSSPEYTTLETIRGIAEKYLGQFVKYKHWARDPRTGMFMRPEEESLDAGYEVLSNYFSTLGQLPSHTRMIDGKKPSAFREDEGHLLFRPLGQLALAEAVGALVNDQGLKLQTVVDRLEVGEKAGMFDIRAHASPFYGVTYDGKAMRRTETARKLASRLLIHLLGGGTSDDKAYADLKERFGEARIIDIEAGLATNLKGDKVLPDAVELPSPW